LQYNGNNAGRKRLNFRAVKKIVAVTLAALLLAFAFVTYFFPLKSLLPPYKIPPRQADELRIHFLEAGQGDCSIVEFPSGNILVIDGGDGSFTSRNRLIRYLKGLDASSLSLLVSHADRDHFGAFEEVLKLFKVDTLYLPVIGAENVAYRSLLLQAEKTGLKTKTLTRYGVIADGSGAYVNCISPYSTGETNENDSSAVLYLSYKDVSAVFTGDISANREERLVREYALDNTIFDRGEYTVRLDGIDVLKAAHHGSKDSSSEAFLSLIGAEVAVVSAGRGNSYSHPNGDAISRLIGSGAEIYRIDELGNVVVSVKDGTYSVRTNITE